jgi:hypothetical protein
VDAPGHALSTDGVSLLAGGAFRQLGQQSQQGFGSFGLGSEEARDQTLRCSAPPPPPEPVVERPVEEPPPPAPTPARVRDAIAPVLGAVGLTRTRFRTARAAQRRARPAARRVPIGTRVRYTLSEPAVVRLAFQVRKRVRCSGKPRRKCYRWRGAGALRCLSAAGASKPRFRGRVGRRWLRPGRHRVRLTATDGAGNRSRATRLTFTIVRG